jgi:hypothetical protein
MATCAHISVDSHDVICDAVVLTHAVQRWIRRLSPMMRKRGVKKTEIVIQPFPVG